MKNERGITLIALIITIIILLILTGITMSAIMGDNGILTNAMRASEATKSANIENELSLAWTACMSKYYEDLSQGKATENQMYQYFMMDSLNSNLGNFGRVSKLWYNAITKKYSVIYTSNSSGKSYELVIDQSGKISILNKDIDLTSRDDLTEKVISQKMYAIYYPDTKVLAFSSDGSEPSESDRGTAEPIVWNSEEISFIADVDERQQNFMLNYTSFLPWSQYAYFDIQKVIIINEIYPTDTSFWFNQFRQISSINNIENLRTDFVTNMRYMFYHTTITNLNLTHFNTSNVTNMDSIFSQNQPLLSLNVSSFDTSKVTNMHQMFHYCSSLTTLDISSFDVSNVTDMSNMFGSCELLRSITLGEVFNTSKVTTMQWMFSHCEALSSIDLTKFNTSSVENMNQMFLGCKSLKSLDFRGVDFLAVKDISSMCSSCESLTEIIFDENTDTSNIENMMGLFSSCKSLEELDLNYLDISGATNISSMFNGCESLRTLDVTSFDTSNVTNMSGMFNGCKALNGLDITNFDTSNVTNMNGMFNSMTIDTVVYISEKFVINSTTNISGMTLTVIPGTYTAYYNKLTLIKDDGTQEEVTPEQLKAQN